MSIIINYLPFLGKTGSWVPNTHYKFNTCKNSVQKNKYQTVLQHASTMHCQLLRLPPLPDHSEQPANTQNVQGLVTISEQILSSPSAEISDGFTGTIRPQNLPLETMFFRGSQLRLDWKTEVDLGKDREKKVQTSLIKDAKNLCKSAIVEIEMSRISGSHFLLWNCPEFQKCQAPT